MSIPMHPFSARPGLVAVLTILFNLGFSNLAVAQPLFLYGVDGDDDTMIRLDVNGSPPLIELLGTVVVGSSPVQEMEALDWDAQLERLVVVSNAGSGPLYRINPNDITGPPPSDIPASFVGNTGTIQMEGIAYEPDLQKLFGVDNRNDPACLVDVNRFTGQVSVIGPLEDATGEKYDNMEGLAFSSGPTYTLYGTNNPGEGLSQLVTIDTSSGLVTPIGTGVGFVNVECLAFGPDGTLYGFSNGSGSTDEFITIDIVTGEGALFETVDPHGLDIEGCVIFAPEIRVRTDDTSWSRIKKIYGEN